MQVEDSALLEELLDILEMKYRTTIYEFEDRSSDKDLKAWAKFASLVNGRRELSVEQIVSLCVNRDAPEDLKEIHVVLRMSIIPCEESTNAYTTINTGTPLYRCVNFHKLGSGPEGYKATPASLVGTAPAKFAQNGRFNEKGDMMFYGASDPRIAVEGGGRERGVSVYDRRILYKQKDPGAESVRCAELEIFSIFSLSPEDIEKRESYLFLRQFIDQITCPAGNRADADELYKPIQVFTKYLQKLVICKGIECRSSLAEPREKYSDYVKDRCYVLFTENRDCLDDSERTGR